MPDTKFLERLHGDSPAARYDLLPEELRDSYKELLEACADAHAEPIAPYSMERAETRLRARSLNSITALRQFLRHILEPGRLKASGEQSSAIKRRASQITSPKNRASFYISLPH